MKMREDVQVHEKTPKIHLVPSLDKDPKEYLKLYETIYREICDRLNHGCHIGGYVSGVDGIDLLNGEILDHDGRSLEGEVKEGRIYRGQMFQMALVSEGIVSFGEYGYKNSRIPYHDGESKKAIEPMEIVNLDEQSLSILEQIAGKYGFRVVSEIIQPFFKEKYTPDAVKAARQNPQHNNLGWMYENKKDLQHSQQTSGTPNPTIEYRREATQVYKR